MDLLQIIKLVSIPRWVKFFSLFTITTFIAIAIYAIFGGERLAQGEIVQAGMGLLGVLLPLSIAIILLTFYEAGVSPLKKATRTVLTDLVPNVLGALVDPSSKGWQQVCIETMPSQDHICYYRIVLQDGRLLRLEIQMNVRKICTVFSFEKKSANASSVTDFQKLQSVLKHTLSGAMQEGYIANGEMGNVTIEGVPFVTIVLYKSLPNDFLWNSAEKLYFAQDLQVMIASMINEAGNLLLPSEQDE